MQFWKLRINLKNPSTVLINRLFLNCKHLDDRKISSTLGGSYEVSKGTKSLGYFLMQVKIITLLRFKFKNRYKLTYEESNEHLN